jgi:hypothetical protein
VFVVAEASHAPRLILIGAFNFKNKLALDVKGTWVMPHEVFHPARRSMTEVVGTALHARLQKQASKQRPEHAVVSPRYRKQSDGSTPARPWERCTAAPRCGRSKRVYLLDPISKPAVNPRKTRMRVHQWSARLCSRCRRKTRCQI